MNARKGLSALGASLRKVTAEINKEQSCMNLKEDRLSRRPVVTKLTVSRAVGTSCPLHERPRPQSGTVPKTFEVTVNWRRLTRSVRMLGTALLAASLLLGLIPPPLVSYVVDLQEPSMAVAAPVVAPLAQTGSLLGTFTVDQANCTNQNGTTNTTFYQNSGGQNTLDCVINVPVDATITEYIVTYTFDPDADSWQSDSNQVDVQSPDGTTDTHTGLGGADNNSSQYTYTSALDTTLSGQQSLGDWHIVAHDTGYPFEGHNLVPAQTTLTLYGTLNAQGTITIVKNTVGGDATFDFTSADADLEAVSLTTTGNIATSNVITKAGGTYVITEDALAGWELTNIVISGTDGATASTVDVANSQATINIDDGDAVVVTFTNQEEATLTVTKSVVNDSGTGSAAVGDFTLTVDGGVGNVTSGAATVVTPGTYTVSESGPTADYAATFGGDCDASGSVTIAAGQDLTCTITNDDLALGTITVVKNTVGSDGTFTYSSTDADLNGLSISTIAGTGSSTTITKTAGTYTITEDALGATWTLTGVTIGGTDGATASVADQANSRAIINLDADDAVVVTFTNTEQTDPCIDHTTNNGASLSVVSTAGVSAPDASSIASVPISTCEEPASLALEKTLVSPANGIAMVGDTMTFQLQITNSGSVAVTELNLVDRYDPAILQYVTASITPDNQSAGSITWTGNFGAGTGSFLPNLPLAPSASFTVTVDFEVIGVTKP